MYTFYNKFFFLLWMGTLNAVKCINLCFGRFFFLLRFGKSIITCFWLRRRGEWRRCTNKLTGIFCLFHPKINCSEY